MGSTWEGDIDQFTSIPHPHSSILFPTKKEWEEDFDRWIKSDIEDAVWEIENTDSVPLTSTQLEIDVIMGEITDILIEKNRKYGDSALEPERVFSKAPPDEQLRVRLDDKISRLRSGQVDDDEDVLVDLIGYLVLLMIYKRRIKDSGVKE